MYIFNSLTLSLKPDIIFFTFLHSFPYSSSFTHLSLLSSFPSRVCSPILLLHPLSLLYFPSFICTLFPVPRQSLHIPPLTHLTLLSSFTSHVSVLPSSFSFCFHSYLSVLLFVFHFPFPSSPRIFLPLSSGLTLLSHVLLPLLPLLLFSCPICYFFLSPFSHLYHLSYRVHLLCCPNPCSLPCFIPTFPSLLLLFSSFLFLIFPSHQASHTPFLHHSSATLLSHSFPHPLNLPHFHSTRSLFPCPLPPVPPRLLVLSSLYN